MKLGKQAPKHDLRTLRLANYLDASRLPPLPLEVRWFDKCDQNFGMMGNSEIGDCTCAAIAHAIQVMTANESKEVSLTTDNVIRMYERFTGYDPSKPETDQGGIELDILKRWQSEGTDGNGAHKIDAFVALEPRNDHHLQGSVAWFGFAYIGLALPLTAQNQKVWSVVPNTPDGVPGSWGGHAVVVVGYDEHFYYVISWGEVIKMTKAFAHKYVDEASACLSPDWYGDDPTKAAPSGFNLAQLQADLAAL
jgi:hypothetical protein